MRTCNSAGDGVHVNERHAVIHATILVIVVFISGSGWIDSFGNDFDAYLDTLPTLPHPEQMRMTPRNIHGVIVYQTEEEDRRLSLMEGSSVVVFLLGLGSGLVYLRKRGIAAAIEAEEDELTPEEISRYS